MQPVHGAGVSGAAQTIIPPELDPEVDPELDPDVDPEPEPEEEPDDEPEPLPELPLDEVPPLDEPLDALLSLEPESLFLPSVEASRVPSKMSVAPLQ
jgi:hypothetical protein